MFFYLSKILTAIALPSSVTTLLLVAGAGLMLWGRWRRVGACAGAASQEWSRRLLLAGVGLLLVCGLSPLGNIMVLPLEQRFARPELPAGAVGIIVLGGFEQASVARARQQLVTNEAAERLTETLLLARRLPGARVIFTGGDGTLVRREGSAAAMIGGYLRSVGIEPGRIVLEDQSRTTYENALYLKAMLAPKPGERFVLVTSAFHMPRSVGVFRQQGFDVVPWPVDYRTSGPHEAFEGFSSIVGGLERVDFAFREWVGLVAYRLSGRSNAIWPG